MISKVHEHPFGGLAQTTFQRFSQRIFEIFFPAFNPKYIKLLIRNEQPSSRCPDCYNDIFFSRTGRRVSTVISMMFAGAFCLIFSVSSIGFIKAGIYVSLRNAKLFTTTTDHFRKVFKTRGTLHAFRTLCPFKGG